MKTQIDGGDKQPPPPISRSAAFADPHGHKRIDIPAPWESLPLWKRAYLQTQKFIATHWPY
ncbi:MAG: hypothetical protein M3Q24_02345 [bacterium]|nr:hypothetical protein [bacterium]